MPYPHPDPHPAMGRGGASLRSWGSIALGVIFACGTAASIFWDVRALVDVTPDHMMTALVLVGTIASGHMFWRQARAYHIVASLGLGVLFVGGTFYCVTTSASRNVEVSIPKVLDVLATNQRRRQLEVDIAEAQKYARETKAATVKNCASGEGPGCKSLTKLSDAADSHYWMLVGRLANSKPEQPANPGLHHAAEVFAAMPFAGSAGAIEHGLVLFSPFVKALFLEVATVVFFGIGLGHRVAKPLSVSLPTIPTVRIARVADNCSDNDTATVVAALRRAGRPISNDELAALMGVTKGEASRRTSATIQAGLATRKPNGRHVAISLRQLN